MKPWYRDMVPESRTVKRTIPWIVPSTLVAVLAVIVGRRRFDHEIQRHLDELRSDANAPERRVFTEADIDGLPDPVRRYFESVLAEGQPYVRTVRLDQRGQFRLGGRDAQWRPLDATQHFSVRPPAFVWDAEIGVLPLLSVHVLDLYKRRQGFLRARLLSAIPVASAGPSPEMNAGELVRYLAEAVWFPTALLPASGVEWEAVDERSARATLEHDGVSASLVFHFNERGEVERVTTERYRQEDDSFVPWTGRFSDYEVRNGLRIPTDATVEWNLSEEDLRYWRASIERIEHHTEPMV